VPSENTKNDQGKVLRVIFVMNRLGGLTDTWGGLAALCGVCCGSCRVLK
jgi:hypothetical protein